MKNLKSIVFLLAIAILPVVTSCDKTGESVTRVAMLAQGITFDDQAFLQSCKAGLEQSKTDFGIECQYDVDTTTTNYLKRLEYYGEQNFDLVIAVGYMWNDAVVEAAKEFPDTDFVLVDAELSEKQSNSMSILFEVDEVSYPLGYLSAWWALTHSSENPAVGYVGALEVGQTRQLVEPYLKGVDRFNDEYQKSVAQYGKYTGTFIDSCLGGQVADSLINLGANVVFGVGGQTGNGALIRAGERGKWGIGVDVDQAVSIPEASEAILSSAMKRLDNAIYAVVKAFMENHFSGGGIYTGNLSNNGVQMAPYHNFEQQIPDSVKSAIENIKVGIIDGSISTGWGE
ncbi:MAG: BMP family ABC transporter substrate-binding protein [Bacteroidales bacterium]|nr:BMP family ABC transporter substrate-binding protein [Bacteroidales bacterium]